MGKRVKREVTGGMLASSVESQTAASVREALGCGEEPVEVHWTPRDKPPGHPDPGECPTTIEGMTALLAMDGKSLIGLGLGPWDGGLFLFPFSWYSSIPRGFPVEDMMGEIIPFEPGKTSRDRRYGCLCYGVRIGPPLDGDEVMP